jgi:hypothetical protein
MRIRLLILFLCTLICVSNAEAKRPNSVFNQLSASSIYIDDAGSYYTGITVEAALQEIFSGNPALNLYMSTEPYHVKFSTNIYVAGYSSSTIVYTSSITTATNDVLYISTDVYITGYSSATSFYAQQYIIGNTTIAESEFLNIDGLDQSLATTDAVTFTTVDTGEGANELFDMDQNVQQADAVTTGQGANELYDMDQNVLTTSSVTFTSMTILGDFTAPLSSPTVSTMTVTYGISVGSVAFPDGTVQVSSPSAGTPGGSDTQMQYNNSGSFGGTSEIVYDGTTMIISGSAGFETSSMTLTNGIITSSDGYFYLANNSDGKELSINMSEPNGTTLTFGSNGARAISKWVVPFNFAMKGDNLSMLMGASDDFGWLWSLSGNDHAEFYGPCSDSGARSGIVRFGSSSPNHLYNPTPTYDHMAIYISGANSRSLVLRNNGDRGVIEVDNGPGVIIDTDTWVGGVIYSTKAYCNVYSILGQGTTTQADITAFRGIEGVYSSTNTVNFSVSGPTLTYTGTATKQFLVNVNVTATCDTAATEGHWVIVKNSSEIWRTTQHRELATANDTGSIGLNAIIELQENDTLNTWVAADKAVLLTNSHYSISVIQAD